jgi:prepilin-type N-terminal cleavage/methylation domain-containing protein
MSFIPIRGQLLSFYRLNYICLQRHLRCKFSGMTLLELMLTLTIMGILATIMIPSVRALQGRQTLLNGQREVQSALYRLQKLALSPPVNDDTEYTILGYGLGFYPYKGDLSPMGNCAVNTKSGFIAVHKFVTSRTDNSGTIKTSFNGVNPGQPCPDLTPSNYPNDIFVLPQKTEFNMAKDTATSNEIKFPWIVVMPLFSSGSSYGALETAVDTNTYQLPFAPNSGISQIKVILAHQTIKVGGNKLCRSIIFSKNSSGIDSKTKIEPSCS